MTKKIGFSSSNRISSLPWEDLKSLGKMTPDEMKAKLAPFTSNPSVLGQLMAFIASTNFVLVKNANGKISSTKTLEALKPKFENNEVLFLDDMVCTRDKFTGILSFLTVGARSLILPSTISQVKPEGLRFNAAVPLFMSAFKEYRNVKYSSWDLEDDGLKFLVDAHNLAVLKYAGTQVGWSKEVLQSYSAIGRKTATGRNAGTTKHINSAHSLNAVGDAEFDKLPKRVRVLLCQTWVYQPSLYTPMGVYNLTDIDAKPEELTPLQELFKTKVEEEEETLW